MKKLLPSVLIVFLILTTVVIPVKSQQSVIIIDNLDAGFSTEGSTWTASVSQAGGKDGEVFFNGSNYFHDGSSGADSEKWAKWSPQIPAEGKYKVYMMWCKAANRPTDAPIEIKHKNGVDSSITVNQREKGGLWNYLGTYTLSEGNGNYVKILASSAGYTVADAVKFEPDDESTPITIEDILIDNTDSNCILTDDPQGEGDNGKWKTSSSTTGYQGSNYATTSTNAASDATAVWNAEIKTAGQYNVYMTWTALSNRTAAAPVEVKHKNGIYTDTVNQRLNSGNWNLIGTFEFAAGGQYYVKLTASSPGYTIADAVKFEYVNPFGVTNVSDYQVYQRTIGALSGSVPITVTNTDENAVSIKARVLKYGTDEAVTDWTELVTDTATGTIVKTITVPQGGWYQTEIKSFDSQGKELAYNLSPKKWGVGINILCVGQSNMEGHGYTPYTVADDLVANFNKSGSWGHLTDPYADTGGSMAPSLGNELSRKYNIPVGFIPAAVGGSGLVYGGAGQKVWSTRNAANPYDTSTHYGNSLSRVKAAGGAELIVWSQGSTDARYSEHTAYGDALNQLIRNYRTDLFDGIPFFICQTGTHNVTDTINNDDWFSAVRTAQALCDDEENNIYMAVSQAEFERVDSAHFSTPALNIIGKRVANAVMYHFGDADYYRGPRIISARFAGQDKKSIEVKILHNGGDDIITSEEISGFTVLSDNEPIIITSAIRKSNDSILLTLERSAAANPIVRYLHGVNPDISNIAKDNSPLSLPLECTVSDIPVTSGSPVILIEGSTIIINSPADLSNVTFIIAGYKSQLLHSIKTETISLSSNTAYTTQLPAEFNGCDKVKVMLWTDTLAPLYDFAEK